MDADITNDTIVNGATGSIVGAAVGAGLGYAFGGPRAALKIGAISAVGLGAGAALTTYYLEHQRADALADIEASNRRLRRVASYFARREAELKEAVASGLASVQSKLDASNADVQVLRTSLDRYRTLADQAAAVVRKNNDDLRVYEDAVRAAHQGQRRDIMGEVDEFRRQNKEIDDLSRETLKSFQVMSNRIRDKMRSNGELPG